MDLEADRAFASTERTRAQASIAGFFADEVGAARIVAVGPTTGAASVPALDVLIERAESVRGELLALRKEADAARFSERAADRRRVPEPEIVAGTKSSTLANGNLGTVLTVQAVVLVFDP